VYFFYRAYTSIEFLIILLVVAEPVLLFLELVWVYILTALTTRECFFEFGRVLQQAAD
jgi:hypothetical protein